MRRWLWHTGPVAANGEWTSPVIDLSDAPGLATLALSLYAATASITQIAHLEWSDDQATWRICPSRIFWDRASAVTDNDTFVQTVGLRSGRFHRVRYINGATAQAHVTLLLLALDFI